MGKIFTKETKSIDLFNEEERIDMADKELIQSEEQLTKLYMQLHNIKKELNNIQEESASKISYYEKILQKATDKKIEYSNKINEVEKILNMLGGIKE